MNVNDPAAVTSINGAVAAVARVTAEKLRLIGN